MDEYTSKNYRIHYYFEGNKQGNEILTRGGHFRYDVLGLVL